MYTIINFFKIHTCMCTNTVPLNEYEGQVQLYSNVHVPSKVCIWPPPIIYHMLATIHTCVVCIHTHDMYIFVYTQRVHIT